MIGHFVNNLTREQEDRVLTRKLAFASSYKNADGSMCLVGAAGYREDGSFEPNLWPGTVWCVPGFSENVIGFSIGYEYDVLVQRFGERVNVAIRNRILANRARRALQQTYANQEAQPCHSSP